MSSLTNLQGRIWIVGDSIDTDQIVPSHVLTERDPQIMAAATLENILPEFSKEVQVGDILIAGKNFGTGSSREEAVFVLKSLGIACILAKSIARIFYRNAVNLGLPPIVLPDLSIDSLDHCSLGSTGDIISVDLMKGTIQNEKEGIEISFKPFPSFLMDILLAGGAIPHLQQTNS